MLGWGAEEVELRKRQAQWLSGIKAQIDICIARTRSAEDSLKVSNN